MAKTVARKTTARRNRKNIDKGAAHIHSSFNNTIVSITDVNGILLGKRKFNLWGVLSARWLN